MKHAKPLLVRPHKIKAALSCLKSINFLYAHIKTDFSELDQMPSEFIAPVVTQLCKQPHPATNINWDDRERTIDELSSTSRTPSSSIFKSVLVTDVDGQDLTSEQMKISALQHLRDGKPFLAMKHGEHATNDYNDLYLYALLYPTLFPYGFGSPDNIRRSCTILLQAHAVHLFCLGDRRFQEHNSFLFVIFNILQCHAVNLSTYLLVQRPQFLQYSTELMGVTPSAILRVAKWLEVGGPLYSGDSEERLVSKLMQQVTVINQKVPGTSAAKLAM